MPSYIGPAGPATGEQWFPGRRLAGLGAETAARPAHPGLLPSPPHAHLLTPRGRLTVFAGDWVVTEATGHRHVCPDEPFRRRYAPVAAKGPAPGG